MELDVQRTADGQLVIIHDETVNRTSDGSGWIKDLTLPELRRLNFHNGFVDYPTVQIPTLRETLDLIGPSGIWINVELKNTIELYPGMEEQVLQEVVESGWQDQVIFSSFNHFSLANLRDRVAPENLALLYHGSLFDPWQYAKWFGAGAIHPHHRTLRQKHFMWLCHEAGIKVRTWPVNDEEIVKKQATLGVDAIITGFPERMRAVVDGMNR